MWKKNFVIGGAGLLLTVVGIAGIPDDLQTWSRWVAMIDHDIVRYLLVSLGLSGIAFSSRQQIITTARQVPIFRRVFAHSLSTTLKGRKSVDYAKPIDPADWENVEVYSLYEAACLWVDVEPHNPIEDAGAKAQFFRLRSAMATGRLPYQKGLIRVLNEITGERSLPTGSSILTAIDLR